MQARVRIIKRISENHVNVVSVSPIIKSERERERETVNTVKGWVTDWHERKVQLQTAADALIRSVSIRGDETTQRLARVH